MKVYVYDVLSGKEIELLIKRIDSISTPSFIAEGVGKIYLCLMNTQHFPTFYSFFKLNELEKRKLCKLARWG